MPFTLAHPAAVLPLRRTRLPFSALVVGSMSPDFEYLLRLSPTSVVSHTPLGLVSFCVPASLVVLGLFHELWLPALRVLCGREVRPAGAGVPQRSPLVLARGFLVMIVAILVGALTHLIWDAFTHEHGWAVARMPLLVRTVFETRWGGVRVYKLLQHGSTLAGMGLLARAMHRQAPKLLVLLASVSPSVVGAGLLAFALALAAGLVRAWGTSGLSFARTLVGSGILVGSAVLLTMLTLFGLLQRVKRQATAQ